MKISDLLAPERIACGVAAPSKKRVLHQISDLAVAETPNLTSAEVFETLVGRERLGSTGIGHGVAIPHGRIKAIDSCIGILAQLAEGIDFDAVDHKPVDLLFALLVPESSTEEHLETLAKLAEMFSDKEFCEMLRAAKNPEEILALLQERDAKQ